MTGTFYTNGISIKENVKKVNLFRKKGNLFVIATGNNYDTFKKVVEKYKINYDYLILDQGSCIVDKNNKLVKANHINNKISNKIIEELEKSNEDVEIFNEWSEEEQMPYKNITKISARYKNLKDAKLITKKINEKYNNYVHAYTMIFPKNYIVEIISSSTDKKEAIKVIEKKEKISKKNIYTIGNGYNDMSMIDYFNGYCMQDSVKELFNKCKNHVDSVSELINKLLEKDVGENQ